MLSGVKLELAAYLSAAKITTLQSVLMEALENFSCISFETCSSSVASLWTCGEDEQAIQVILMGVIDSILSNGAAASMFSLHALVHREMILQHLPPGWVKNVFRKAGFLDVNLQEGEECTSIFKLLY